MNRRKGSTFVEIPSPCLESPGDLVPPIDLWMEGEIDFVQLPDEEQRSARLILAGDEEPIQRLTGREKTVRFLPGDLFTGLDRELLLDRLVLSPSFGSLDISATGLPRGLIVMIDGEEVDVSAERAGLPIPASLDFQEHPIVSICATDESSRQLQRTVLYEARPWLLSEHEGRLERLIPIPTNEMGEESDYRRTFEAWVWVIEMTQVWAESRQPGYLDIDSVLLREEEDPDEMESFVSQAAQGGSGVVRMNGVVVFGGRSSR